MQETRVHEFLGSGGTKSAQIAWLVWKNFIKEVLFYCHLVMDGLKKSMEHFFYFQTESRDISLCPEGHMAIF